MEKLASMKFFRAILFLTTVLVSGSCSKDPLYPLEWTGIALEVGWINDLEESITVNAWRGSSHIVYNRTFAPNDTMIIKYHFESPNAYLDIKYLTPCAACPDSMTIETTDTCFKASTLNTDEDLLNWDNASKETDSVRFLRGYFVVDPATVQNTLSCD